MTEKIRKTHFKSRSHLLAAITIGTLGKDFFALFPLAAIALILASKICSLSLITSSKDSLESILNTRTKISPGDKKDAYLYRISGSISNKNTPVKKDNLLIAGKG